MSAHAIRIVVAEGQPLFRRGAVAALGGHPQLDVVAETANGEGALEAILDLEPDIAVLDGAFPDAERTHLLREITRRGTRTQILILIAAGDPDAAQSVLTSGVGGYLTRDADEAEICGAAILVAGGGTVISEVVKLSLAQAFDRTAAGAHNPLSTREQEVLARIAQGQCAREIGEELHRSEATVKSYLRRSYDKLGVSTQAAAVAVAMQHDLITYGVERSLPRPGPRGTAPAGRDQRAATGS